MRKIFVWALMAALVVAGSAFAAPGRVTSNATFSTGGPATTNNDDSCDIGTAPAATLLLPYFEVDIDSPSGVGETTIFTITNTSNLPHVAHITLWTDWSFPVIDFNVYLTGYDVQSINLFDVISRGEIAPPDGTGSDVSPVGSESGTSATADFNNPVVNEASCVDLPVDLPAVFVTRMQSAFTLGRIPASSLGAACNTAGGVHDNAVGYATIDVAGLCSTSLPIDPLYFESEIRFDNVLVGDYIQVNGGENFAQGNPLVHIRAIPEGGFPADPVIVNFDRTFYTRYQDPLTPTRDRRQPLPATFAARWISGGGTDFQTFFKIWREGITGSDAACADYPDNGELAITELVRFDEEENPDTLAPGIIVSPPIEQVAVLPETSLTDASDTGIYPPNGSDSVGGWMYLNLDYDSTDNFASQNWVISSMRAEGRFSVDFDAAWLGNGCSGPTPQTSATTDDPVGSPAIGPSPNITPDLP